MGLKEFIKKNKLFSIISLGWIVWITFLISLSFIAKRTVTFIDALDYPGYAYPGVNVSTEYNSVLSLTRYLLEPFAALAFILVQDYEWILGFMLVLIIFRILFVIQKRRGMIKSDKAKLLWYPVKDIIRTSFIVFTVLILAGVSIVAIWFFTTGMYLVNLHFMLIIQIIIPVCFIIIVIKFVFIAMKWFHPNLKLNYSEKKRYKKAERVNNVKKLSRTLRREISYLIGISFLLLGSNLLLLTIQFPGHTVVPVNDLEEGELLLDFHIHTSFSDGWITPEERVMWYLDHGLSGAAFSDHDNLRGSEAAQAFVTANNLDFLVFKSQEWTDHDRETGFHMNIYGLNEPLVPLESSYPGGPKAMNASDTILYVKANGGFVTVNHYNSRVNELYGGRGTPYNYTQLYNWGVDGFEIVNGGGIRAEKIREFCLNITGELGTRKLACVGGSDVHTNEEINTFVRLKLADPTNLTLANIFATLKNNTHQVVAIDLYPNMFQLPDYLNFLEDIGFGVFEGFANYFSNIDSIQVLSWIIWSCIGYLLLAFLYRQTKKLDLEKVKRKILV